MHHASVMTRTKLRFSLLRNTLATIRGFQGKRSAVQGPPPGPHGHDFSLIPRPRIM